MRMKVESLQAESSKLKQQIKEIEDVKEGVEKAKKRSEKTRKRDGREMDQMRNSIGNKRKDGKDIVFTLSDALVIGDAPVQDLIRNESYANNDEMARKKLNDAVYVTEKFSTEELYNRILAKGVYGYTKVPGSEQRFARFRRLVFAQGHTEMHRGEGTHTRGILAAAGALCGAT
ncbi:hypothetical protein U1Q18_049995 [Sarracenia purpurea var. burkii]